MVEWELAVRVALGGFGMVFTILLILCLSVWMTKSVVEKIEGEGHEK